MVADATAGRQTTTCPDCGTPVRPDRERLCPSCGYPLVFLREAPDPGGSGPARTPGEQGDTTNITPAKREVLDAVTTVDDAPLPAVGEIDCPRCGERNPMERVRCQRCGLELNTPQLAPPPLPPPAPPPAPNPMARRLWPVAGALLGAAVLIGGAVVLSSQGPDMSEPPRPGASAAGDPGLVRVDRKDIRASASSTIPNDPRFSVANTLDGDRGTAWQSDGKRLQSNVGVSLTYRFGRDIQLARITVINGYNRTPQDYANNERVRRLQVRSGSWSKSWELKDTADPQSLDIDPGAVAALTLQVEAVYPGARFKDLALSEVAFEVRA